MKVTQQDIDAARDARGGWSRRQLIDWNVPHPPPHGWQGKLIAGDYKQRPKYKSWEQRLKEELSENEWREPGEYRLWCDACGLKQTQKLPYCKGYRATATCEACRAAIIL